MAHENMKPESTSGQHTWSRERGYYSTEPDAPLPAPFTVSNPTFAEIGDLVGKYGAGNVKLGADGMVSVNPVPLAIEEAPGSGTGRYGDGADHWTQTGDGTDYPGWYGVGPVGSDGKPLEPFVPYQEGAVPESEPVATPGAVEAVPAEGAPDSAV